MKTLQTKLLLGLLPTLAILVLLGLWAVVMFYRLGGNIDVILRENFTSILAAEGMKEAIERMDSGLLFAVGGRDQHGRDQFDANRPRFLEHLKTEQANITLPGEGALADSVDRLFSAVRRACRAVFQAAGSAAGASSRGVLPGPVADVREHQERRRQDPGDQSGEHVGHGSPCPRQCGDVDPADDRRADRGGRAGGRRRGAFEPVDLEADQHGDGRRAALARGELDQLVPAASRDELGELANAFNEMARTLARVSPVGHGAGCCGPRRPGRRRSNRFRTRWSWSIPWARSSKPTARPGGCLG